MKSLHCSSTLFLAKKICKQCKETPKENMKAAKNDCENNKDYQDSSYLSKDFDRTRFNSSAEALGFLSTKPVGERDAVSSYAQNKAKHMKAGLNEELANVMEISNEELNESSLNDCTNCKDSERLIVLIKEKLEIPSPRDQIKILKLTPESWSIKKTIQEFGVTEYKVKCVRELKKERGILAEPNQKVGKALSGDVSEIVNNFYQHDEYSRCFPGMKDFVSVTKDRVKTKHHKCLLLLNVKELFLEFKKEYPTVKTGFSKLCELRPKWVKTVNHNGMHSICACQNQQNVKLLVSVIPGNFEYKDILSKVVCNVDLRKCMVHLCSDCPGKTNLNKFLTERFMNNESDLAENIFYKQWISTDCTTLVNHYSTVEEFIAKSVDDVYEVCPHQFIAKAQVNHLKMAKENLSENELIILLDIAENYSFVVQDAVQGFYCKNSQATLHPFSAYFRSSNGDLKHTSICVRSDCLKHDQTAVHCF